MLSGKVAKSRQIQPSAIETVRRVERCTSEDLVEITNVNLILKLLNTYLRVRLVIFVLHLS